MGLRRLLRLLRHPARTVAAGAAAFRPNGLRRTVVDPSGNPLLVLLPDLLSLWIYADREYERDVVSFAKLVLRPGMAAFDVGAHVGMHTMLFSRLVGEGGRTVAFEPIDLLYEVLSANAAGDSRIRVEKIAVADGQTTELALKYFGLRFSGWTTAYEPHADDALLRRMPRPRSVRVPAISLDAYTDNGGIDPDLIKLDIEGGELAALRGARRLISRARPFIIMECGDRGRSPETSSAVCLALLERAGYEFLQYDGIRARVEPHHRQGSYPGHCNLLCAPKERRPGA